MEEKNLSRALSGNPLGVASLIVSILGFAMSLFALSSSVIHHSSRIADSKRVASKGSGLFDSVASATVGLVPTCRNRFGVLDGAGSRPNLLRSSGPRPLNAGAFLGLGLVAHQTYCEARAQGPASRCSSGRCLHTRQRTRRAFAYATVGLVPTCRNRFE